MRVTHLPIVIAVVAWSGCANPDQFHSSPISTELTRLDGALKTLEQKLPPALDALVKRHREALVSASATSSPVLRLYRLRDPSLGVASLEYFAAHPEAAKDLAAFEKLWNGERAAIAKTSAPHGTRVQRALAEAAANRAQVLFHASLPYARNSSPGDGLYYLAEAVANRKFAEFLSSLGGEWKEGSPSSDAVEAALDELDSDLLAAFEKEPSGKTTIPASALAKEGRELWQRGAIDGATLKLIEARLELAKRAPGRRASSPPKDRGALPNESKSDDTLHALIAAMSAESDLETSKILRAEVAPAYGSLFAARVKPNKAAGPVTITLVRWPYT